MKTVNSSLVLLLTILGAPFLASAQHKIEEQVVGPPYKPGTMLTLSAKGMRFASTHMKDNQKWVVMIDGAEGAEYDEVLKVVPTMETQYDAFGVVSGYSITQTGPVAFSPDGKRYAYAARAGEEVLVILDGKEIFRAKRSQSAPPVSLMQFTPDSQHLYFYNATGDTMQSHRLMMDGKPATPAFDGTPQPQFSADGSHWMLYGGDAKKPMEKFIILDGKNTGYPGDRARITPDGKHVVSWRIGAVSGRREEQLLLDGKQIAAAFQIPRFKISPAGDVFSISQTVDRKNSLYRNGTLIEGTDGAIDVLFSPDGRRWAASCSSNMNSVVWVFLDGKKHKEYKRIAYITFSPDSTKCAYNGESDKGWHTVVNGEEGEANAIARSKPTFAKTGNIMLYTAGPNTTKVYYNGKVSAPHHSVWGAELSPNGERLAYHAGVDGQTTDFTVDGVVKSRGGAFPGGMIFSADSKHLAAMARHPKGGATVYLDDYFFPDRYPVGEPKEFTPDGNHLITAKRGPTENGMVTAVYCLDGEPVVRYSGRAMTWMNSPKMIRPLRGAMPFGADNSARDPEAKDWEHQPDGSIIFIANTPGPEGYGPIKKIKVTPSPTTTFADWIARVKVDEAAGKFAANAPQTTPAATAAAPARPQATAAPPTTRTAPAAAQAAPTASTAPARAAAPARPLTWADLVNHPERWPAETKINAQLRFNSGTLPAGSSVRIEQVTAAGAQLIAPQGFVFNVNQQTTDLLQAANAAWAKFTPEQQAVTPATLANDPTLWPGKVKVIEAGNFGSLKVNPGTELPLIHVKPTEIGLAHSRSKELLMFSFSYTDVFSRAREIALLPVESRPGRMADTLDGITLDWDGKTAAVPKANYYVFYFAASTCPRCKVFTPKFVEHYNKTLAGRKDVALVSWPTEATTPPYLQYARENTMKWPTIPVERKTIFANLGVFEIPGILVVDRFGKPLLASNKTPGDPMSAAEATLAKLNETLKPLP